MRNDIIRFMVILIAISFAMCFAFFSGWNSGREEGIAEVTAMVLEELDDKSQIMGELQKEDPDLYNFILPYLKESKP